VKTGFIARTHNSLRDFVRGFSGFEITVGFGRWPAAYNPIAPIAQTLAAIRN
jgi:hypothetical protein